MRVRSIALRRGVRTIYVLGAIMLLAAFQLATAPAAHAGEGDSNGFIQTNLVSDLAGARTTDANLKNPWGIVHGPTSPWWVSDNNGNVSTLYDGNGNPFPPKSAGGPLVVQIPAPGATTGGTPTGIVFNGVSTDFVVTDSVSKKSGSSLFIFATEDGTIAGWSPGVSFTQAFIAVDESQIPDATNGAVYKGLAIATTAEGQRIYATNFRAGSVDVFDAKFSPVNVKGAFTDKRIPAGYAPFGIQAIGNQIYVTYAVQNAEKHDDLKGPHRGFVDVFSNEGKLLKRLVRRGALNSPWGIAVAPKGFGDFGGDLLVGNFGDGTINAFDIRSGELEGTLRDTKGARIVIDGLWGIAFGNDHTAGPAGTLFFSAGINDEADGLFGSLAPAPETPEGGD
jgi:uncharacterized protein (TIGR03118 family)